MVQVNTTVATYWAAARVLWVIEWNPWLPNWCMQSVGYFCDWPHIGGDCLQGWVNVGVIVWSGQSRVTCVDEWLTSTEGICASGQVPSTGSVISLKSENVLCWNFWCCWWSCGLWCVMLVLCKLCKHSAHLDFEIVLSDLIRGRDLLLSIFPSEARESMKLLYSVKFLLEL